MNLVFDDLILVRVNKGDFEGNPYFQAFCLENGYTHKFACSKAFYDTFSEKLKEKELITLHNVKAEYKEFGDKKRIKLI